MTEIERKWVLAAPPPELAGCERRRVEQGYVALDDAGAEVRVRRAGDELTLTVKSAPGLARVEEELPLSPAQFESLWALTEGRRVVKTRHLVPLGELTAEVDVYEGGLGGLVTAEVEFGSEPESEAFAPPEWLGREVTGDKRYANRSLAVDGAP
jgi:CYTH domain-containing protein